MNRRHDILSLLATSLLHGFALVLIITVPAFAAPSKVPAAPPNSVSFELNEKGVESIRQRDFEQAENFFRRALAADTGNITAAYNLAGMYLNNKKQQAALTLLDTYIKEFPKDAGLYSRRGDAHFSLKNIDAAARDYEMAYSIDAQQPGAAAKLSTIYTLQRKTEMAEKMLLTAIEQEPKNAQLLQNLSNIFLVNGKTDKAISTAKRGLQVNPNPELYVTLGNAYESMKDFKNSLIAFQRAADLGDTRPELQEKIAALKKHAS